MTEEHAHKEYVPQTDPNATSSTQASPDSQEPPHANAPRTDHEYVPQTDPNATSSTHASPDSQEPPHANAPRTDHEYIPQTNPNATSSTQASPDSREHAQANAPRTDHVYIPQTDPNANSSTQTLPDSQEPARANAPRTDHEYVPQTDPNAISSTQARPDSQEPAQANAPRIDHDISPFPASLDAEKVDKENVRHGTMNPTSIAQKYSASPGGIWAFTWNEIIHGLLQVIGVIAALVFGAWAIKSYETAEQANSLARTSLQQAVIANQLALLVGCGSNQVSMRIGLISKFIGVGEC